MNAFKQESQRWQAMAQGEPDLKKELEQALSDQKALEDRFYTDLSFGTAGMRGVLGVGPNRMNVFTVRRAAAGLAEYLLEDPDSKGRPVAIGYDSRRYSDRFAKETALVLARRGVKALLFDALRPVPVLSYAVRHLNAAAGVVITASHNPPEYNGFKAYGPDGAQLSPEAARVVTEKINSLAYEDCAPLAEDEALAQGMLAYIGKKEVDDDYTKMVLGLMARPEVVRELGAQLRIVFTPLHGSGNLPVRRVLKEAGIQNVTVVPQQELPDPDFSTVKAPNPEDPGAFALAIPLAKEVGASVIIGTDPDCDRLGVCVLDSEGMFRTLTGNQIGCLLLYHLLSQKKQAGTLPKNPAAIKSIVTTELARAICEDHGAEMFEVLTGFKFIGEKIQQFEDTGSHAFVFGFEESFGYLSSADVRDKDAVNAALLVAEAACLCLKDGITLYDRLQQIYRRYGYYFDQVLSTSYPGKEGAQRMKDIMAGLRNNPPASCAGLKVTAVRDYKSGKRTASGKVTDMGYTPSDVLYFELEGGHWLCVRPSGTEPKIKVYLASSHPDSMEKARELCAGMQEEAKAWLA